MTDSIERGHVLPSSISFPRTGVYLVGRKGRRMELEAGRSYTLRELGIRSDDMVIVWAGDERGAGDGS